MLDITAAVLVVRIRIDYNIRPVSQTGIQSCHKALSQTSVFLKIDNIMDSPPFCHCNRLILAAVIDNQVLNLIYSFNMLWKVIQSNFQCFCFVVAGNLYY